MSQDKTWRALLRAQDQAVEESGNFIDLGPPDLNLPEELMWRLPRIVEEILSTQPELQRRVEEFFEYFGPAYEDLQICVSVNRMIGLQQFGIKTDITAAQYLADSTGSVDQITSEQFRHTRCNHCEWTAAVMIAFGLKLDLPEREIATGALGALLHDIGHPAFGHDIDDILVDLGEPTHEERGARIIRLDTDLHDSFDMVGVEIESVISVIEEQGALGRLQSIADTLAYVVLDHCVVGQSDKLPPDFIWQVIESVDGIEDDRYLVNRLQPMYWLVRHRANMYRDVYGALHQRIVAHVLRSFYKLLIDKDLFTVQDFMQGTDSDIKVQLSFARQAAQSCGRLPRWFDSAMNLSFGIWDELYSWETRTFGTEVEAQYCLAGLDPEELATSVLIKPWDYRKKIYRVIGPNGREQGLQAPKSHLPEEFKKWYVLYYPS